MKYRSVLLIMLSIILNERCRTSPRPTVEPKNYCREVEKAYNCILNNNNIDIQKISAIVSTIESSQDIRCRIQHSNSEEKYKYCKLYVLNRYGRHQEALDFIEANNFFHNSSISQYSNNILLEILKIEYYKQRSSKKTSLYDMIAKCKPDTIYLNSKNKKDTVVVEKIIYKDKVNEFYFKKSNKCNYIFSVEKEIKTYELNIKDSIYWELNQVLNLVNVSGFTIDSIEYVGSFDDIKAMKNVKMNKDLGQVYDLECLVNNQIEIFNIPPGNNIKSSKNFIFVVLNYLNKELNVNFTSKIKLLSSTSSKLQIQVYASPK